MKTLTIITDENLFLGQGLYPWQSMDITLIELNFNKLGYEVEFLNYLNLLDKVHMLFNKTIIYTSSQKKERKKFIEDFIQILSQQQNILIPSYNILKSHDNKGFQEILKRHHGIPSLESIYFLNFGSIPKNKYRFPIVLKTIDGAGSHGVSLANNTKEVRAKISRITLGEYTINDIILKLKETVKKQILKSRYIQGKAEYRKKEKAFLLQRFIPNLTYDYKVLIFYDKYFVLKRHIKKSDFRASGSGNFEFIEVDEKLLTFAEQNFKMFNVPFISFDICHDGKNFYLLEFQGTHFGPYTLMFSEGYYIYNGNWKYIKQNSVLEDEFCLSITKYLENNK